MLDLCLRMIFHIYEKQSGNYMHTYENDLLVKSKQPSKHLQDLQETVQVKKMHLYHTRRAFDFQFHKIPLKSAPLPYKLCFWFLIGNNHNTDADFANN